MAKPLRDVAPKAPKEGALSGVKKSKTEPMDISDFNAAPGNQEFAKKHEIEKHADRVGNGENVYNGNPEHYVLNSKKEKRHGYKIGDDKKVYEAKGMKCESCGSMYEGESCGCDKPVPAAGDGKKGMIADKKKLQEVLTKKTSTDEVISDFVHSDNPKFEGKSKKERIKMALGAYYSMHPEKSKKVQEDLAMPMLESGKKKKMKKESAPGDTPMRFPSGNVGDTGRV